MAQSIEEQMLVAMELFHYSYRFRERLFALILENDECFDEILSDLRVLQSSHVRVIICSTYSETVERRISALNQTGFNFKILRISAREALTAPQVETLKPSRPNNSMPVVLIDDAERTGFPPSAFDDAALSIAHHLNADKVFFLSDISGLEVDGVHRSHPSESEIKELLSTQKNLNIGAESLRFLHERRQELALEVVVLEGKSGSLFREIFTHRGVGTLFTGDFPNECRNAEKSDIRDIALLMKPAVNRGALLPVGEEDILRDLCNYFVYTVNGEIVASAKLTEYDNGCELAKFCTLPRYQGKGRAKKLAEKMISSAAEKKKKYVFALSVEPKMKEFFLGLGFREVTRESLPDEWRKHYNFDRPSQGFKLLL